MKKTIRTFSIVFALLLVVSCFAGCASENGPSDEVTTPRAEVTEGTAAATEESKAEESTAPTFAEADYGGETFTVYMRVNSTYNAEYIDAEGENGDVMNDNVWRRNVAVEEKYKISIETKTAKKPHSTVVSDISSGALDYDLIIDRRCELASLATSGVFADFNKMGIDFSRPWWDDNAKGYEIAGRRFFMANDVNVNNLSGARFLYFNKDMVNSFKLDQPYELVKKNQWTLDNFLVLVRSASETRAEGELGIYGLLRETGASNGNHMHLLVGCGVKATEVDASGELSLTITDQIEKISNIYEKLKPVLEDTTHALTYDQTCTMFNNGTYKNKFDQGRGAFAAGHFLFVQNGMGVAVQFADMSDDYGLVPNPKYDSDQQNYYHKIDKYSVIWAVPKADGVVDYERVANVFDYWAYVSSNTVMPAFYEITIKTRRFSDATASDMLDIVKGSLVYDVCDIFGINVNESLDAAFTSGNVASTIGGTYRSTTARALDKLVNDIKEKT